MEDVHLTPRELLRAIIRQLHWVLLAAILGGMFGFCLCRFWLPPQYTATGSLYVSIPGSESADPGTASAALTAAQKLAKTCLVSPGERPGSGSGGTAAGSGLHRRGPAAYGLRILPGGTRKPSLFLSPHRDPQTATLLANAILDTAPAEILRIVHTGRIEVVDRAVLPVQPDAPTPGRPLPLQLASPAFRQVWPPPLPDSGEAQAHSPAPAAGVCRSRGDGGESRLSGMQNWQRRRQWGSS